MAETIFTDTMTAQTGWLPGAPPKPQPAPANDPDHEALENLKDWWLHLGNED